jgi:diguanylate cyclase (GGDEF)-like protein
MRRSLKVRLTALNLGLIALAAGSVAFVCLEGASTELRRAALERLEFAAEARRYAVVHTLENVELDLKRLVEQSCLASDAGELPNALDASALDHNVIVQSFASPDPAQRVSTFDTIKPTTYGRLHQKVHAEIVPYLERKGYTDFFIVDVNGRVVYSSKKGFEFGRSVTDPKLSATELPNLFAKLKQANDKNVRFRDFSAYPGGVSAFMGIPVFHMANVAMNMEQNDERGGYLIVRLSPRLFDLAITPRLGLGLSGTASLRNENGFIWENAGDTGPVGAERLAADLPIKATGVNWTITVAQRVDEALASVARMTKEFLLIGVALTLVVGAASLAGALAIFRPIAKLTIALRALAKHEHETVIPGQDRRDEIGEISRAVTAIRDMTIEETARIKKLSDENWAMANLDVLTGVGNRRNFIDKLDALTGADAGVKTPFALGIIDLDGFKPINDLLGHAAGDAVLVEVARRLKTSLGSDCVGRLGGDEFAFVIKQDLPDAELMAEATLLNAILAAPMVLPAGTFEVGASIGLARFPTDGTTKSELLESADVALYEVKKSRPGTSGVFCQEHVSTRVERFRLDAALRSADLEQDIALAYEPIVHAATGRITEFEIVPRCESLGLNAISIDQLFEAAERTELAGTLSRVCFTEALRSLALWPDDIGLSFKLWQRDICCDGNIRDLLAIIKSLDIAPGRITFAVTETMISKDLGRSRKALGALKQAGLSLALDAFGTGDISLRHIHDFSFDQIRVHDDLLESLETTTSRNLLVKSIIDVCANAGITCVVTGVASAHDHDTLEQLGCTLMQGPYFSSAVDETELAAVILSHNGPGPRDRTPGGNPLAIAS